VVESGSRISPTWAWLSNSSADASDGESMLACSARLVSATAGEGVLRDRGREPDGLLGQLFVGDRAVDESDTRGLLGVYRTPGVEQLSGVPDTDDPGEQPRCSQISPRKSDADEHRLESRGGACQPHVGGQGQAETATRGGAVHRGDHWLGQ
jgi:hypothetical protein